MRNLTHLAVLLICWGVAFPVYGIPTPAGKITGLRAGLFLLMMVPGAWSNQLLNVVRNRFALMAVLIALIRMMSLLISSDRKSGIVQLEWFSEGLMTVILLLACALNNPALIAFLAKWLLVSGAMSLTFAGLQCVQLLRGAAVFALPLSTSIWGIIDTTGWYPMGVDNRLIGAFQEPNQMASYSVYVATICLATLLRVNQGKWRAGLLFTFTLCAIVLWFTGSRQGLLTFAAIFLVYCAYHYRTTGVRLPIMVVFGLFLGSGVIGTSILYYSTGAINTAEAEAHLVVRTTKEMDSGEIGGGRLQYSVKLIQSLGAETFLLGIGEGSGEWTAHNAYLITLQEAGLLAAMLLLMLTVGLLLKNQAMLRRAIRRRTPLAFPTIGALMSLVWVMLISMNWAQLNQNQIWPFLVFVFATDVLASNERTEPPRKTALRSWGAAWHNPRMARRPHFLPRDGTC